MTFYKFDKAFELEEFKEEIRSYVEADCWGMYDTKGKVYFDSIKDRKDSVRPAVDNDLINTIDETNALTLVMFCDQTCNVSFFQVDKDTYGMIRSEHKDRKQNN